MTIPTVTLSNGIPMPLVGLGTFALPKNKITEIIRYAHSVGYRKLDTAWYYDNETEIGEAIRINKIPREELFITTKLHLEDLYLFPWRRFRILKRTIRQSLLNSCRRLGVDYVDMYMIHSAFPHYLHMLERVEGLRQEGLVKAVGVSNWLIPHFEKAKAEVGILPQVSQFEISPYNTNQELVDYCFANNMCPEGFSSLGGGKNAPVVINDPLIGQIAKAHNRTPAQIVNRWLVQRGISILPRSKTPERIRQNIEIFDFELSPDEIQHISALNCNRSAWPWTRAEMLAYL